MSKIYIYKNGKIMLKTDYNGQSRKIKKDNNRSLIVLPSKDKYGHKTVKSYADWEDERTDYTSRYSRNWQNNYIKIVLLPIAYQKMMYWAEAAIGEVSGLLLAEKTKEDTYQVNDAVILKQKCSGAYTDLDKGDIVRYITELGCQGIQPNKVIKGWWHSHVNFGVFWSGTDEATAQRFGFDEVNKPEWWVSIVVNKHHNMKGRIDTFIPIHNCLNDDIKPEILVPENKELREVCNQEVKTLVSEYKFKPYKGYSEIKKWRKQQNKLKERKYGGVKNGTDNDTGNKEFVWRGLKYVWNSKTQHYESAGRVDHKGSIIQENNLNRRRLGGVIHDPVLS